MLSKNPKAPRWGNELLKGDFCAERETFKRSQQVTGKKNLNITFGWSGHLIFNCIVCHILFFCSSIIVKIFFVCQRDAFLFLLFAVAKITSTLRPSLKW